MEIVVQDSVPVKHEIDSKSFSCDFHASNHQSIAPRSRTYDDRGRLVADFAVEIAADVACNGQLYFALAVRAASGWKQIVVLPHKVVRCPYRLKSAFEALTAHDVVWRPTDFSRAILATRPEVSR